MFAPVDPTYYTGRAPQLVARFGQHARTWEPILATRCGESAAGLIAAARQRFVALLPQIPYIGGDANRFTGSLVRSAMCLALYQAMPAQGYSAAAVGRVFYDAITASPFYDPPPIPSADWLTPAQLMERRRVGAAQSQRRLYPDDYVYTLVEGDGDAFDYGYDFTACAAHKFYQAQGAGAFLPFFCFLDFPLSRRAGHGLERTQTLAEGAPLCDHRFKQGRQTEQTWPPPFLDAEAE